MAVAVALGLLVATDASADGRRRVAVLPVVVHANGDSEHLQSGVADMLAARLGREPGVAVIRVVDPSVATTDLEAAQEAARAVGAEYVLYGSFTQFGEGASLDVRCAALTEGSEGAPKAIFIQSGAVGDMIPRLDGLVEKVGRYVRAGELPPVGAAGDAAAPTAAEFHALRSRVDALEAALAADHPVARAGAEPAAETP